MGNEKGRENNKTIVNDKQARNGPAEGKRKIKRREKTIKTENDSGPDKNPI